MGADDSRGARRRWPRYATLAVLALIVLVGLTVWLAGAWSDGRTPSVETSRVQASAPATESAPALPTPSPRPEPVALVAEPPRPDATPRLAEAGAAAIVATVRDENGAAVAGYALDASTAGPPLLSRVTDGSGTATWEGVSPGRWTLDAQASAGFTGDGFVVHASAINAQFAPVGDSEVELEVAAGATARHTFEVARRATVSVRLDEIPNESELEELSLGYQSRRLHSAIEGTEGATQVVWSVAPGPWVLSARWSASSSCWSRPVLLELQPGEHREVSIVSLPTQVTWGGRVADTEGQPVGGVVMTVAVRERGPPSVPSGSRLDLPTLAQLGELAEKRVSSADDGTWSLAVPAGSAVLRVDTTNGRGRYLARFDGEPELRDPTHAIDIVVASGCIVTAAVSGLPASPDLGEPPRWTLGLRRQVGAFAVSRPREETLEGDALTLERMAAGHYEVELSCNGRLCATQRFDVAPGFREGERVAVALDFSR